MGFKLLTLITALGLGVIGLIIWVWFASYPGGSPFGDLHERQQSKLHAYYA
jgi:hypothetical protein